MGCLEFGRVQSILHNAHSSPLLEDIPMLGQRHTQIQECPSTLQLPKLPLRLNKHLSAPRRCLYSRYIFLGSVGPVCKRRSPIDPILSRRTQRRKNNSGCCSCIAMLVLKTQVCSSWCLLSTIKKWRHLCYQEWELLSNIDAYTKFLGKIGVTIGVSKDDIDDLACAAQCRGSHFNRG